MNFIIFDLECDTVYSKTHGSFINEIIEVGAVKLDSKLNITDEYHQMVRSGISKKLSGRIKKLTGITDEEIKRDGIPFAQMVSEFEDWAHKTNDNVFVSWSDSDIHMLVANLGYFTELRTIPFIDKYADLQRYTMKKLGITGSQISLTDACEKLKLNEDDASHHRALDDSKMCVDIMKKCYQKREFSVFIKDTKKDCFYERLFFKPYVIKSMKNPFIDKKDFNFRCPKCHRRAKPTEKFRFSGHAFKAKFECPKCKNLFLGNVRVKKNFDSLSVYRFTSEIGEKGAVQKQNVTEKTQKV